MQIPLAPQSVQSTWLLCVSGASAFKSLQSFNAKQMPLAEL